MSAHSQRWVDDATFRKDVSYLESLWQRRPVGSLDLPILDLGQGEPLIFVPILEHLEFVYARQIRSFSKTRRVILYRRQETRSVPMGLAARVAELDEVLTSLDIKRADFVGHGDAAMVLLAFALRYPERCRSLTIIAQGADYRISPHPLIWWLHELFLHLPIEHILPAPLLRRMVIKYITAHSKTNGTSAEVAALPRHLIEEQFRKIRQWPALYKFSVLPIIHSFDISDRLQQLTMPILLLNRPDDVLSPLLKTNLFSAQLPACAGYHIIAGRERFFMYAQADEVNQLLEGFLTSIQSEESQKSGAQ
ncbi:alpha/beta hydrolase [Ktedonosporobacter rubrisoli]|uniref:Alpha/beta hydrolase n=1 Tax=Ktedonosporobacter rubrisoli TaxID=2509675 RepID=A0A4P6K165_KTERU|nr:alpha/beta hydrolase [Ktedonosporobacter rubrisoli]QBD81562.1 alpha/beta hydrolase [Ktedonosporobacter rubrisoli]